MIKTDHKPLIPLLKTKHLNNLPPRVLRYKLCLSQFKYKIRHVLLYTADTLLRTLTESCNLQEADLLIEISVDHLPSSSQCIEI